ncbi:MAG: autotransporter domain-containing protein, partial [Candidatus Thermoplasmatota archaeon]|nr:autotransporter domain-containing protein [Candidatus Thermoplasmatota archaeon]
MNTPTSVLASTEEAPGFSIDSMLSENTASAANSQSSGHFNANSFNGSAGYSYAFALPEGRLGMTPTLSLSYDSLRKNNFNTAGYGWDLNGLNYIERNNIDGIENIYQSEEFSLVLNGSGKKIIDLKEEISDSDNRYEFVNNQWTVKSSNGLTYYFGLSEDTRLSNEQSFYYDQMAVKPMDYCNRYQQLCRPGGGGGPLECMIYNQTCDNNFDNNLKGTLRWYLEKVEDVHGNTIDYSYTKENNNHQLKEVLWGGNEYNNLDHLFKVDLIYEDRPDVFSAYEGLMEIKNTERLKSINISANNQNVREYILNYSIGDNQTRSLLGSIDIKSYDDLGNYDTRTDLELNYYQNTTTNFSSQPLPENVNGNRLMDINGDGLADSIYSREETLVNQNGWET